MKPQMLLISAMLGIVTLSASAQDTLRVNSGGVALKFENDRVRALESVLKPGEKENTHSHPRYVTYVLEAGTVQNHRDGKTSDYTFKKGEVLYRDALTHWSENIGRTASRVIMFELKEGQFPGGPYKVPSDQDPLNLAPQYYEVRVDNDFVRVLEYRLGPGQKEPMHSHPCRIVYSLTDAKWKVTTPDGRATEGTTTSGDIQWRENTIHAIENIGKTETRAITIEFKGPCKKVPM